MPPFLDLPSAYDWLDGHVNHERDLGSVRYDERAFALDRFRDLLEGLGSPHVGIPSIHVAGSCGKGSSVLAIEAMLRATGERVATYMSPHPREYRERIRIDGEPLSPEAFVRALGAAADAGAVLGADLGAERSFKTVFEYLTAAFFLAAREAGADRLVVETGLGGRLDATNVLPAGPVLWTRIDLEHTRLLGDTLAAIAGEKAAILKPGGRAVFAEQAAGGEAERVFRARGEAVAAPVEAARDLCPLARPPEFARDGTKLAFRFMGEPLELSLPWFGPFLVENVQGALATVARLFEAQAPPRGDRSPSPAAAAALVRGALESLRLPGRMSPCPGFPRLLLDGGHCPAAARAVAETMRAHFRDDPAVAVVGMASDKDRRGFFRELAAWPGWRGVVVYRMANPRATPAEELAASAREFFPSVRVAADLTSALESATRTDVKDLGVVLTGTVFSVEAASDWGRDHGRERGGGERSQT